MAVKVGGTDPGAEHDLAIPFECVGALLRKYRDRDPDKIALVDLDQDKSITFGQMHDEVNRIARRLAAMGVGKGDRVAVLSDERLEKLILWMGIWRAGAVIMPLNVEMNIAYIAEILRGIKPKLTLWHEDMDVATMTAGVGGDVVGFTSWDPDAAGDAGAGEFFAQVAAEAATPELDIGYRPDDVGSIYCTSGTTDKPKLFVCDHMGHWLFGLSTIDATGIGADDRTLEYRSFGWNSAQILSLLPWLQTGCTLHIANRFSHRRFFEWIKTHAITFAAGVPTVVNMLLNEPLGITAAEIPSLRLMTCSTAPLSPDQWARFERMYGVTLLQLYGMSEAGWICGNRHDRRRMGTVGPPAKHQDFRIVDGDGRPCPPGVEGEVTVGGPQTCVGTISPDGEFEDLRGTRMRTGDLAVIDEDGFVTVTGRTKDLIIRGGVNIAPLEIDNVLLSEPRVLEAAAIGVPDEIYGEEIVCYVVAKPGEAPSVADLRRHCAGALAPFKVPKAIRFIDALPRTDRGKISREALKRLWARDGTP